MHKAQLEPSEKHGPFERYQGTAWKADLIARLSWRTTNVVLNSVVLKAIYIC